jgi:hypothetical protein
MTDRRARAPTERRQLEDFRRRATQESGAVATGARVIAHEDEDAFTLQIELGADHAIVLTYWKTEPDPPSVSLWHGSGEHDFGDDDIDDFREWAGRAMEFITAPYGACVDCGFDTFVGGEYYAVHDAVWKAACEAAPRLHDGGGLLCIGCLERRLGRELTRDDFIIDNPLNQDSRRLSDRIRDRLRRTGGGK